MMRLVKPKQFNKQMRVRYYCTKKNANKKTKPIISNKTKPKIIASALFGLTALGTCVAINEFVPIGILLTSSALRLTKEYAIDLGCIVGGALGIYASVGTLFIGYHGLYSHYNSKEAHYDDIGIPRTKLGAFTYFCVCAILSTISLILSMCLIDDFIKKMKKRLVE